MAIIQDIRVNIIIRGGSPKSTKIYVNKVYSLHLRKKQKRQFDYITSKINII